MLEERAAWLALVSEADVRYKADVARRSEAFRTRKRHEEREEERLYADARNHAVGYDWDGPREQDPGDPITSFRDDVESSRTPLEQMFLASVTVV